MSYNVQNKLSEPFVSSQREQAYATAISQTGLFLGKIGHFRSTRARMGKEKEAASGGHVHLIFQQ